MFKGDQVVGAIGLANKPGGYSEADVKALESLLKTTSVIFDSYRRLQNENQTIHGGTEGTRDLASKLLDGALKFSGAEPAIDFTATQLVDEWLFCMTDNGIGFMQTEARETFKMLRKLDRNSEGTGMGLAIAELIVEFHGGRIWAESEPGQGTKFYFTLPLVPIR